MVNKCLFCKKELVFKKFGNKKKKYCSLKCRSRAYYHIYYEHYKWRKELKCPVCEKKFIPVRINQICCSGYCRTKKWRIDNREKDLVSRKKYNANRKICDEKHNKDKAVRKKWRDKNKDKKYNYKRDYRAKKVGNGGTHTKEEFDKLKEKYHFTCPCCKKSEPEIKLTEDHIIPLSCGGTNDIGNIQPLCHKCNSTKNTKTFKYNLIK